MNTVIRYVPVGTDRGDPSSRTATIPVDAELFECDGVRLMLHESIPSAICSSSTWRCSDEATGFAIGKGETKEGAKADGISKLHLHWAKYPEAVANLPIINNALNKNSP